MNYEAPLEFVNAVKGALSRTSVAPLQSMRPWAGRIVEDGWINLTELSNVMEMQDPRTYHLERHLETACRVFGLPLQHAGHKPRNHHSDFVLFQSLAAVDAAALMVRFEHLGFAVDPSELVGLLAPKLQSQRQVSLAELDVLHHAKNAGRCAIALRSPGLVPPTSGGKLKSGSGYKVEWHSADGWASVEVRGPRYRKPKELVEQRCSYCNFRYTPGDLDSSIEHRREHLRHQRVFDPQPLRALTLQLAKNAQADVVTIASPKWAHKEMYERAIAFKREMGYDLPQWSHPPPKGRPTESATGYFLAVPVSPSTIAGACAFRLRDEGWTMDWAWLAPKYRRSGLMQRNWPRFVQLYGDFHLEYPLSEAMQSFVLSHGTEEQQRELQSVMKAVSDR